MSDTGRVIFGGVWSLGRFDDRLVCGGTFRVGLDLLWLVEDLGFGFLVERLGSDFLELFGSDRC